MNSLQKINFPYLISKGQQSSARKKIIFFGTDFYNLPLDSNRENYIIATNKMLDYVRKYFLASKFDLLYQPHPNEKEEFQYLNLNDFVIGEKKVAEILLYENAQDIEYVFSTCSWANGSAYSMGINSAVFLDLLKGSISDESIVGYHSYFEGLPPEFFITSFDTPPAKQKHENGEGEKVGYEKIVEAIGDSKKIWVLATDPSLALRGAILGTHLKKQKPGLKMGLFLISNRRWENVKEGQKLFDVFDHVVEMPHKRVWYSGRPQKILAAVRVAKEMKQLPIKAGEALISFSNLLFEENCLLSYCKGVKKILFMESRWYFFVYEGQYKKLPQDAFRGSFGTMIFNNILEPILGLHRTVFKEFRDGKVINYFRYREPLQKTYDTTFILMPEKIEKKEEESISQESPRTIPKKGYVKRIFSGGPSVFVKRLIGSSFGIKTARRVFLGAIRRRNVLKKIPSQSFHVDTRKDLAALLSAPAMLLDNEIEILERYSKKADKTIVEIGCAYGASSLVFLLSKKTLAEVYSIDPFIQDSMGKFQASEEICRNGVIQALTDLSLLSRIKDWKLIPDYSFNVIKKFNVPIDFIFIDGDHNYNAVKQDFDEWFPKVKKGGYILFHDSQRPEGTPGESYNHGWPGPSKLSRELQRDGRVRLVDSAESVSVFEKVHE